jgi:hypothetical protein
MVLGCRRAVGLGRHSDPIAPALPAEFRGLARQFRATLAASDWLVARVIADIIRPLRSRAERHPVARRQMLLGAVRQWRELMPEQGRLDLAVETGRNRLNLVELRASAGNLQLAQWQGGMEIAVVVQSIELAAAPGVLHVETKVLAAVGLHGLARRYQRGGNRSAAAIYADLMLLGRAHAELARAGGAFSVPTMGGKWAGAVFRFQDGEAVAPVLAARTYFREDEG